jgi:sialidase-1
MLPAPHATGLIFRNPVPHLHSVHAYFPSVVALSAQELVATVVLGEAFEAVNLHTHRCRSTDGGRTWVHEGPLYPGTPDRLTSDCARLTALPGGELVAFMIRHDRTEHPDEGLTSHQTLGFVPTELLLLRSRDGGHTWTPPALIAPPIVGPAFEMCCPLTPLRDGRWLIPTQTWPGWAGDCPNGIRMGALVSRDGGRTWPTWMDVMHDPAGGPVYFWESKIVELPDGRLLAVAWVYDDAAKADRPNHYALSADGGQTWTAPASTGLRGQTLTPLVLPDGRVLVVYRRIDQPGLWATLARLDGERWVNEAERPLWGQQAAGLTASSTDMAHNFNVLRFGAPSLTRLADGTVFIAFWAYEDTVSVIRYFLLDVR